MDPGYSVQRLHLTEPQLRTSNHFKGTLMSQMVKAAEIEEDLRESRRGGDAVEPSDDL